MENLDSWQLVQLNAFDEACRKADAEYAETKRTPSLRHKIYGLLHLKMYREAQVLADQIIDLENSNTDVDFIFSGVGLWLLGKKREAIEKWGNTEETHYKDAAGGVEVQVLLYFGAVKTGDERLKASTLKVLKKLVKSKRNAGWPAPLGSFILDEITVEELFLRVVNIPTLRERQLCQAHFVVAVKELEKGNASGYLRSLADCISYGPPSYLEQFYYLAKGELESQ